MSVHVAERQPNPIISGLISRTDRLVAERNIAGKEDPSKTRMNVYVNGRYHLRPLGCSVTRSFLQGRHELFIPVHMASLGQISTFLGAAVLPPLSCIGESGDQKFQLASGWRSSFGKSGSS